MFRDEVLANTTRRQIYETVNKQPGLHLREIERRTEIPLSTLNYHLDFLVRYKLLERETDGHYTRFYAQDVEEDEKKLLTVLRQKTLRNILLELINRERMSYQELLEHLQIPASTLSFYMNKLLEADTVLLHRIGRENFYTIKNEHKVARTLIVYKSSFLDNLVDNVLSTWMERKFSLKK
jgi:predicted transcriptional regulator